MSPGAANVLDRGGAATAVQENEPAPISPPPPIQGLPVSPPLGTERAR